MYLGCRMTCQTVLSYRSPTAPMGDHALIGHPRLRIFFDLSQSSCLAAASHQLSEIQPKQWQSPPTSTLMLRDALYLLACNCPFDPLVSAPTASGHATEQGDEFAPLQPIELHLLAPARMTTYRIDADQVRGSLQCEGLRALRVLSPLPSGKR